MEPAQSWQQPYAETGAGQDDRLEVAAAFRQIISAPRQAESMKSAQAALTDELKFNLGDISPAKNRRQYRTKTGLD